MKLYRYHSPYRSQFIQAKGTMGKVRSGCILVWDSQYYRALGECAPLNGFSEESILECLDEFRRFESEVENVLTRFEEDFTNCPFPSLSVLGRWEQEVTQWFNPKYPSLRFGISMLMYDWLSQRYNQPMHSFFLRLCDDFKHEIHDDANHASIPVNALLPILDMHESLSNIAEIIKKGYEVVKIKVSGNHEDNIRLLSQIKDRAPNLGLRLDANAQWSAENFLPWAKKILRIRSGVH
jgi:O-succinylbenzoate synthase